MREKMPAKGHCDIGTGCPTGAAGSRSRKTVLVADDHPVIRMGVSALLESEPEFQVIAEVSTCTECCERAGHTGELRLDTKAFWAIRRTNKPARTRAPAVSGD